MAEIPGQAVAAAQLAAPLPAPTSNKLDGAKSVRQQFFGFVGDRAWRHQPEPTRVVGQDRTRLTAQKLHQRHASRRGQRIPAGNVEARHRHANDALHTNQREAL